MNSIMMPIGHGARSLSGHLMRVVVLTLKIQQAIVTELFTVLFGQMVNMAMH